MKYFEEAQVRITIHRTSGGHCILTLFCEDVSFLEEVRGILVTSSFVDEVTEASSFPPALIVGKFPDEVLAKKE